MELELNRTALPYHDLIFHTQVTREETMEMIVPDAYPDISKLLDTSGICCLNTREASEGTVSLAGRIRCRILYLPEEDNGEINSLGADLDFQCSVDQEGLTAECHVVAIPRLLSAETKAINPRKMLIRVNYEIAVRAYRQDTLMVPCGVLEPGVVEEKQEQAEGYFVVAVPEKRFQFQDQLNLSGSQPAMAEILRIHPDVTCGEAKLIGGKLVFKGEVSLWTLYRSVDHNILVTEFVLPFSQIMDAPETEETAEFQLEATLLDWTLGELSGDGRSLAVEVDLYACAEIRTRRSLPLLADAYSVRGPVQTAFATFMFPQLVDRSLRRETKRELLETGGKDVSVLDVRCTVVQTSVTKSAEQLVFKAGVQAELLCVDEDGTVERLSRHLTLESEAPVTGDVEARVSCTLTEGTALPAANGVELRVGVAFQTLVLRREERLCISALELDESTSQEQDSRPSIVLRQMIEGESLWDIAKAYATTISEIRQANGTEEESAEPGQLLLIPHKR